MSTGIIVEDAIVWDLVRITGRSHVHVATVGEWSAGVWRSGSGVLPWRGKLRRNEDDHRVTRSYRTEQAAKLAMGAWLRKVAT